MLIIGLGNPLSGLARGTLFDQRISANPTLQPEIGKISESQKVIRAFLPVVQSNQESLAELGIPIWSHQNEPASHEVSLFRSVFRLGEDLLDSNVQIFADTRYEVWIDGVWIGRGPARFSIHTHEYDRYNLGKLEKGNHLIAVLAQWAPNNRRSESTSPHLITQMEGKILGRKTIVTGTGTQWKSINSDAWNRSAIPVHAWGLIGPTELLDYRRLPSNWMRPDFNDEGWSTATERDLSDINFHPLVVPRFLIDETEEIDSADFQVLDRQAVDPGSIVFRPRSLPTLENVPINPSVLDVGLLSPGRRIGELIPGDSTQEVIFTSINRITIDIEVLSTEGPPNSRDILLDGSPIYWKTPSSFRPDVYTGTANIGEGTHSLRFINIPTEGLTFALSDQGISFKGFPFQQGQHAGRRLLLSEPAYAPDSINVTQVSDSLRMELIDLPAYIVLDLGRTIHGRLTAEITGPAESIVDIGWDERLLLDTLKPLPFPGSLHPQWNQVDSWILDGTQRHLGTIDTRAGRYLLIAAWGKGPIQIENLKVYEERLPVEQAGYFSSSDEALNAVWQLGADTLYANMGDAYADPWRERGQWWGDAYVMDHTNRVVFGDETILRRGINFMAEAVTDGRPNALAPNGSGHHMLDFGMLWIQSTADYIERTGDTSILNRVFPSVSDFMEFLSAYENSNTGLLDIPDGSWTQTTYIDTVGQASRFGQSTAVNALYFGTLLDGSRLAELAGYPNEATRWKNKSDAVKQAVNRYLFRPAEHRYVTSIRGGKTVAPTVHAQAWALAYGLVPVEEKAQVASSLLGMISMQPLSPEVEIYGTFWILEALGKAGKVQAGIELIKLYFGHLLDAGATTTWEIYNSDRFFTQSLSHGWGSSPTWFLTTYLLGAKQTGANSWVVKPDFASVEQASGALPLPQGALQISWSRHPSDDFTVEIVSPPDSTGKVILPDIQGTRISLDGVIYSPENYSSSDIIGFTAEGISVSVTEGSHSIEIILKSD